MKHYAGLDVSVKETSVCIVNETGKVCRESEGHQPSRRSGPSLAGSRMAVHPDRA